MGIIRRILCFITLAVSVVMMVATAIEKWPLIKAAFEVIGKEPWAAIITLGNMFALSLILFVVSFVGLTMPGRRK